MPTPRLDPELEDENRAGAGLPPVHSSAPARSGVHIIEVQVGGGELSSKEGGGTTVTCLTALEMTPTNFYIFTTVFRIMDLKEEGRRDEMMDTLQKVDYLA